MQSSRNDQVGLEPLTRFRAGQYVTHDRRWAVVETGLPGDGPRGGTPSRWELARPEPHRVLGTDFNIETSFGPWRTLREARLKLAELRAQEVEERGAD